MFDRAIFSLSSDICLNPNFEHNFYNKWTTERSEVVVIRASVWAFRLEHHTGSAINHFSATHWFAGFSNNPWISVASPAEFDRLAGCLASLASFTPRHWTVRLCKTHWLMDAAWRCSRLYPHPSVRPKFKADAWLVSWASASRQLRTWTARCKQSLEQQYAQAWRMGQARIPRWTEKRARISESLANTQPTWGPYCMPIIVL